MSKLGDPPFAHRLLVSQTKTRNAKVFSFFAVSRKMSPLRRTIMDLLTIVLFVVVYILLTRYIFPRLGVPT